MSLDGGLILTQDEPEGGSAAIRRQASFLLLSIYILGPVGKWESCFWISTFPSASSSGRWECGNRAFGDFQGLVDTEGNQRQVSLRVHQPVISTNQFSFYERPRYRGRQDRTPMSHNSQDSIRAELEVLACSCLRRPQPLCRIHLPQHGLSLQIQHAPLWDRAFLL